MLRLLATLKKKFKKLFKNPKSFLTKGLFCDLALTAVKSACGDLKRGGTTVTNPCCLGRFSEMCTMDPITNSECEHGEKKNVSQFQVLRNKDDKIY